MAVGKKTGGRKKGTPNKATAAKAKAVAESGLTPVDYLLSVMRDENVPRDERVDAANKVAPYIHPKLASVDHKSSDGSMTPKPAIDPSKLSPSAMEEILNAATDEG